MDLLKSYGIFLVNVTAIAFLAIVIFAFLGYVANLVVL